MYRQHQVVLHLSIVNDASISSTKRFRVFARVRKSTRATTVLTQQAFAIGPIYRRPCISYPRETLASVSRSVANGSQQTIPANVTLIYLGTTPVFSWRSWRNKSEIQVCSAALCCLENNAQNIAPTTTNEISSRNN